MELCNFVFLNKLFKMAIRILANDGIEASGKKLLEAAGYEVDTNKIPQEELATALKNYDAILVRSATKVRQDLIDACPNIKLIGRGGVGLDNIDVAYAQSKGVAVVYTPAASSRSVAELVIAKTLAGARFLHQAYRDMPTNGVAQFNDLKKAYSAGFELKGRTMGIVGMGRIGQEVARMAFGLGMNVISFKRNGEATVLPIEIAGQTITAKIPCVSMDELLANSDVLTINTTGKKGDAPIMTATEFAKLKKGAMVVNCARGNVWVEADLLAALESGQVGFAGVDVFEKEPTENAALLAHPRVGATPHIGGSTKEAQERIGSELANQIIEFFGK